MPEPSLRKEDWVTQLLDRLDAFIEFVRSKTTEPLAMVARYLVYGLLFAVVGVAFVTLLIIVTFRGLAYLPGPMWTVYAGASVVFLLTGTFFWRKAIKATR
jgi:H+/Cl- antiporter ClcA